MSTFSEQIAKRRYLLYFKIVKFAFFLCNAIWLQFKEMKLIFYHLAFKIVNGIDI